MAVLSIRTAPDPILKKKATRVPRIDDGVHRLIDDMIETMYAARGVGLAANQVGVPLRILVMGIPESGDDGEEVRVREHVLVNPEIVKMWGEETMEEGCLSIPGYRGEVRRFDKVKVKGLDRDGKEVRLKAEGLMAQAIQHEVDHLDGILYVDRMKEQGTLETLTELSREESEEVAAA